MRTCSAITLLAAVLLTGCGSKSSSSPAEAQNPIPASQASHTYQGTASVGDFMTLTVVPEALTISYADLSNGLKGTASYILNHDGSYTLNDPAGNLTYAFEAPGFGLVALAYAAGPARNGMALITALETGPGAISSFTGAAYNTMGFGTGAGGVQVGSGTMTASSWTTASYWPCGALGASPMPAVTATLPLAGAVEDGSGQFATIPSGTGGSDVLFGLAGGFLALDTPTGSVLALPQAATAAFDPGFNGAYQMVLYQKFGAALGGSGVESGIASLTHAILVISAAGGFQLVNDQSVIIASGPLTAVADTPYLYGGAGAPLSSPCNGMFTCRVSTGTTQQDLFFTFVTSAGQAAVLLSSFSSPLPWVAGTSTYSYTYGTGLRWVQQE